MAITKHARSGVSLKQLQCFIAVVEAGGFRRAAERLGMSQPPLSQHVAMLEQQLGTKLLERRSRGTALSIAGEDFYRDAKMVVEGLDRACARMTSSMVDGVRLTIGLADDFVYCEILALFEELANPASGLEIDTTVELSPTLAMHVQRGLLDAALVPLPLVRDDGGLARLALPPSRLMALVPVGHRLARKVSLVPGDLDGETLILSPAKRETPFARQTTALLAQTTGQAASHRTNSAIVSELLVERGQGIAIISEHSVRHDNPQLVKRPFLGPDAVLQQAIIWNDRDAARGLADFIAAIVEHVAKADYLT